MRRTGRGEVGQTMVGQSTDHKNSVRETRAERRGPEVTAELKEELYQLHTGCAVLWPVRIGCRSRRLAH